jgi:3-oxoacyl-[acyl-carrier protein] reductase
MNKTVLITGAAGPMGVAHTMLFLKNGFKVIAADLNTEKLEKTAREFPGQYYPKVVDISNETDVRKLSEAAAAENISPDIIVNNAGILTNNKVSATTLAEWDKIMAVNLTGPFLTAKYFLPAMIEKKWGRIINITSLAAKSGGITAGTAYTVSKGGLISLTYSLAAETAGTGVTVNGIAPAYVKTPMITEQLSEAQRQILLEKIPVKRFCEPEEVAALVYFLAGENTGFITGEIIDQNGGLLFD